jgi:hypothetical protein
MPFRVRYPAISMLVMVGALSAAIPPAALAQARAVRADSAVTRYRTARVDGIDIFYRETGLADAPAVLLLHGFPTSSHMFRNLIPVLAHRYRVIAPDYPAFGHSGTPDRHEFKYSFARFAELMDGLLNQLRVERYALYVQDYGAPVGRSGIPSASRHSWSRTATRMRRASSNSGIRSRPTGPTVPKRIAKPCVRG